MALPQPLHIFRKDLIHLWPETLFVLVLFVVFAYSAPSAWAGSEYIIWITLASFLIKILMVVSWLVLIARAVQDESLVGDRQFWTSRPYHWASLFAAKILLIFTCIYLPFFLMQCYILHHVGLHPTLVVPALLHNLLLITVVIVIPLAALSAVTSTFPRVLLTFIATAIAILILFVVIFFNRFLQMQTPHLDWIIDTVFIALPLAALLLQYKTRKTLIARALLVATPILGVLVVFLAPDSAIINSSYPAVSGPALTSFSDKMPPPAATGELADFRNYVSISLPIAVAGIDKETEFLVQGIRATVTGPGVDYRSAFLTAPPLHDDQFGGERPLAPVSFLLPRKIFDKIHDQPVDLHLQFAAEQLKADKPSTWHATAAPFSVPGNGICSFPDENAQPNALTRAMGPNPTCRYPLKQPEFNFVTAPVVAGSCANPAARPVPGQANVGGASSPIPDFDPVVTVPLRFQTGDPEQRRSYVLCPGTELVFIGAQTLPNASLSFDQKHVILDPFAERYTPRTVAPRPAQTPAPDAP